MSHGMKDSLIATGLIAAMMVSGVAAVNCGHGPRIKDGVLDCAKGQASAALPDVRMLIDLVSMGGDWKPALEAMERLHTSELVTCIVQRIIFDLQTSRSALSPDDALKLTRLQAWVASRPYKVK